MDFDKLQKVRELEEVLDVAIKRLKKDLSQFKKSMDKLPYTSKLKKLNDYKIKFVNNQLKAYLQTLHDSFPQIDNVDPFYLQLIKLDLDYDMLKKSLGAVNWTLGQVQKIKNDMLRQIAMCKNTDRLKGFYKSYLGRIGSIISQTKEEFDYLEKCRRVMKKFPSVRTRMFTICIAGFPNVGKSTLLGKLSGSIPDIQNYPFTTKKVNAGYIDSVYGKIQMIDTPGTLARKDKMNIIEMHADIALDFLGNSILFVFDLTGAGYTIEEQYELLDKSKDYDKPITVYVSKQDLLSKKQIEDFKKSFKKKYDYDIIVTLDELKKYINDKIKDWIIENK